MIYAAISFGMRPIGMILTIILARILVPEDFGQVGMAMVLLGLANVVTSVGMDPVVVQTSDDINKVAHYAFVIVMVVSLIGTAIIVVFADPFARLLGGGEQLASVLRWMAVYVTLGGLLLVPQSILQRNLKFKEVGLSQIPAELTTTGGAILLALMGYGVWSLVIGHLVGQLLRVILVWVYNKSWIWLRPQRWDRDILGNMVRFGLTNGVGTTLKIFQNQVDTWFVGRTLGAAQVGLYGRAYGLTTQMSKLLASSIFGSVLFPSYARIKDDIPRLTRGYLKSLNMVFLMIVPVSIGLAIVAPLFVPVMLGQRWMGMIPAWQILSLYGLTQPISYNSSPIFLAVGQPKRNMSASIVLLCIMIPLLILLTEPFGIAGAATALSVASLIAMLFNVYQVEQILPGTARKTFAQSLPFFVCGGLMGLGLLLVQDSIVAITRGPNLMSLLLVIGLGAVLYFFLILLIQRSFVMELYELVIIALKLDTRWPRLLPKHLRPSEKV